MKLIITRHGETEENKAGIIQGHLHGTLSDLGKEQARKLAERLKDEKIDLIFSSDLARAKDTAMEIAKFHSEIPFELKEELRERCYGDFEGQKRNEVQTKEIWGDDLIKKYGGESPQEATARIVKLKEDLSKNSLNKTILFVTHNTIGNFLLNNLLDKNGKERLGNTSITIFEFDSEGKSELKLFNCTKHLE